MDVFNKNRMFFFRIVVSHDSLCQNFWFLQVCSHSCHEPTTVGCRRAAFKKMTREQPYLHDKLKKQLEAIVCKNTLFAINDKVIMRPNIATSLDIGNNVFYTFNMLIMVIAHIIIDSIQRLPQPINTASRLSWLITVSHVFRRQFEPQMQNDAINKRKIWKVTPIFNNQRKWPTAVWMHIFTSRSHLLFLYMSFCQRIAIFATNGTHIKQNM